VYRLALPAPIAEMTTLDVQAGMEPKGCQHAIDEEEIERLRDTALKPADG
jgi:hypothetical protein